MRALAGSLCPQKPKRKRDRVTLLLIQEAGFSGILVQNQHRLIHGRGGLWTFEAQRAGTQTHRALGCGNRLAAEASSWDATGEGRLRGPAGQTACCRRGLDSDVVSTGRCCRTGDLCEVEKESRNVPTERKLRCHTTRGMNAM